MTSPISCTTFLTLIDAQLAEARDGHYIDDNGVAREYNPSTLASHPVATTIKIADLFNSALLDAISKNDGRARQRLITMSQDGTLEVICAKNARITETALKALGKPVLPQISFAGAMLRLDAAKIIKKEAIPYPNQAAKKLVEDTLSLSSGSSESSRTQGRMVEKASQIATAFYGNNLEELAALIPEYKSFLAASWTEKATDTERRRDLFLRKLEEHRALLTAERFAEVLGEARALISPREFVDRVLTLAPILSMQALIGAKEITGLESILDNRIQGFLETIRVLDRTLDDADLDRRTAANEALRAANEAQREIRRGLFRDLCAAIPEVGAAVGGAVVVPSITTDDLLTRLALATRPLRPPLALEYGQRVSRWETHPLQRLLTGMNEGGVMGMPYRGTPDELYIQEVLHTLPRCIDPLLRTCLARDYERLPASQARYSDGSEANPGLSMRCVARIVNPWYTPGAHGAEAAAVVAAAAAGERAPIVGALESVLAGTAPGTILARQLQAALVIPPDAEGLEGLTTATLEERAELDATIADAREDQRLSREIPTKLIAYAEAQERFVLGRLSSDRATVLAEMTERSRAVALRGLPEIFEIAGDFAMSHNPTKIVHRYLESDPSQHRPDLTAFQPTRSINISDMGLEAVVTIHTPRVGGGAAAGGGGGGGVFGIMEITVRDPARGLTLSFYHTFS